MHVSIGTRILITKQRRVTYLLSVIKFEKMNKYIHISYSKYITEYLVQYKKKYGTLRKENSPMRDDVHPELDDFFLMLKELNITNKSLDYFSGFWYVVNWTLYMQLACSATSK